MLPTIRVFGGRILIASLAALSAFACSDSPSSAEGEEDGVDPPVPPPGPPAPSDETPHPQPAPSKEGNVVTYEATSLGLAAFSANGRIQPHRAPTQYYFEYGPTTAYGSKTPMADLPPVLAAHYREGWNTGLAGWRGGGGADLAYRATGGLSGGYVRFSEPNGDDYNHIDGVGLIHLPQYFYIGNFDADAPTSALGGGAPDMRDAKVRVSVRGTSFRPNGAELVAWLQKDLYHGRPPPSFPEGQFSNWAQTGFPLTETLVSGNWETIEYRLVNDTTKWTYAGSNATQNRSVYVYAPLDTVLGNMDVDIFHVLTNVDNTGYPVGSIDFDDVEFTYRNRSLTFPSNGGKLVKAPEGSTDPAALTDGWRVGPGKTWTTGPSPEEAQEIIYEFEQPVTIERVQLQQHPEWPTKEVEVYCSADGLAWTQIVGDILPETHPAGPMFAYLLTSDIVAPPARMMKVRINSGYKTERWGLGEIEVFGKGGVLRTDDDWYSVNADITGLTAGQTYHYRLVSVTDGKTELGGDLAFTVPATRKPEVHTESATRIRQGGARLEGRMNSLGGEAEWFFEYGTTPSFGQKSKNVWTGTEITPRTFVTNIYGLEPGTTIYYRIGVTSAAGNSYGKTATFVAK